MSGNSELEPEEKLACAIAEKVLTVRAQPWDVDSRQGAVEAILHYADDRRAAFEVTIVGEQSELQAERLLQRRGQLWAVHSKWLWTVSLATVQDLPTVERSLQQIIEVCEEAGVLDVRHLPESMRQSDVGLEELATRSATRITAHPQMGAPNTAWVRPAGRGGAADPEGTSVAPAIEAWLDSDQGKRKLHKLSASGEEELHLFLLVTLRGLAFGPIDALMTEGVLPTAPLQTREGLTHLWILPPVGRRVLLWSSTEASWTEYDLSDFSMPKTDDTPDPPQEFNGDRECQ